MIVCCAVLAVGLVLTIGVYRRNRLTVEEQQRQRYIAERGRREASKQEQDNLPIG